MPSDIGMGTASLLLCLILQLLTLGVSKWATSPLRWAFRSPNPPR